MMMMLTTMVMMVMVMMVMMMLLMVMMMMMMMMMMVMGMVMVMVVVAAAVFQAQPYYRKSWSKLPSPPEVSNTSISSSKASFLGYSRPWPSSSSEDKES